MTKGTTRKAWKLAGFDHFGQDFVLGHYSSRRRAHSARRRYTEKGDWKRVEHEDKWISKELRSEIYISKWSLNVDYFKSTA